MSVKVNFRKTAKSRRPPLCAFSNGCSSATCVVRAGTCNGSSGSVAERRKVVYTGCHNCQKNKTIYRCAACYSSFASKIKDDHHDLTILSHPSITTLLQSDWDELALPSFHDTQSDRFFFLNIERAPWNRKIKVIYWKGQCPCCYDAVVPNPLPMEIPDFEQKRAIISSINVVFLEGVRAVSWKSFEESTTDYFVLVITVKPVITHGDASRLRYRTSDEKIHQNYIDIREVGRQYLEKWQSVRAKTNTVKNDVTWCVVRGVDDRGDAIKRIPISTFHIGAFNDIVDTTKVSDIENLSRQFICASRCSIPQKRPGTPASRSPTRWLKNNI